MVINLAIIIVLSIKKKTTKMRKQNKMTNEIIKRHEKAGKAIYGDEDDLVLCFLLAEFKKENVKKKVWFSENVKQPSEAGMMCTINGDRFFSFIKNTWIRDLST